MRWGLTRADDEILGLLDDEYARAILAATSTEAMSAKRLSEECGMSLPTASRRLDVLTEHDLLVERTHLDPAGHHYSEYRARLDRVTVALHEGRFDVRVTRREDAADRFTRIWREMRNE